MLSVSEPGRKEGQQFQSVVPDVLGLEASEFASLGAKRFHGKPPLIGLGVHRRSGGGRVQTFAIIGFLFGRALRSISASARGRADCRMGPRPATGTVSNALLEADPLEVPVAP